MTNKEHSFDGYVRIPTPELAALQLRHLMSERDQTIAVASGPQPSITGFTEWVGEWADSSVSVGWDWGVVQGVIVVIDPAEIRTNILLISEDQRAEPRDLAKIHLLHWIESLPWRETAIQQLL
jgi:hypothetical protein